MTTTGKDESEAGIELKAKLTGDVNVKFKWDSLPLGNLTKLLGVHQPELPPTEEMLEASTSPSSSPT